MKSLAESIQILADQLSRLQKSPSSEKLHQTMNEFSSMMSEVIGFIHEWLENWTRT